MLGTRVKRAPLLGDPLWVMLLRLVPHQERTAGISVFGAPNPALYIFPLAGLDLNSFAVINYNHEYNTVGPP